MNKMLNLLMISRERSQWVLKEYFLSILIALTTGTILTMILSGVYSKRLLQLVILSFLLLLSVRNMLYSILLFIVVLFFLTPGTPYYRLNVLQLPVLIIPICIMVFVKFLNIAVTKTNEFKRSTFGTLLFVLFFVRGLSSLNTTYPIPSILMALYFFISSFFVYHIISQELIDRKTVITFISFLVAMTSIVALIGILESFRLIPPYASLVSSTLLASTKQSGFLYRATSTLGNSIPFSAFLLIFFPLSLFLIESPFTKFKTIWFLCSILILSGIICSFSRGAYITLFFIFSIYIMHNLKQRSLKKMLLSVSIILLLGAVILIPGPIHNFIFYRFSHQQITDLGVTHRIYSFKTVANILKESPLLGVGFKEYCLTSEQFAAPGTADIFTPDNFFLSVTAETGLLGVTIVLLIFFFMLKDFLKCYFSTRDPFYKNLLFFVILGIVSIVAESFVFSTLDWLNIHLGFWILVGVGFSVVSKMDMHKEQERS